MDKSPPTNLNDLYLTMSERLDVWDTTHRRWDELEELIECLSWIWDTDTAETCQRLFRQAKTIAWMQTVIRAPSQELSRTITEDTTMSSRGNAPGLSISLRICPFRIADEMILHIVGKTGAGQLRTFISKDWSDTFIEAILNDAMGDEVYWKVIAEVDRCSQPETVDQELLEIASSKDGSSLLRRSTTSLVSLVNDAVEQNKVVQNSRQDDRELRRDGAHDYGEDPLPPRRLALVLASHALPGGERRKPLSSNTPSIKRPRSQTFDTRAEVALQRIASAHEGIDLFKIVGNVPTSLYYPSALSRELTRVLRSLSAEGKPIDGLLEESSQNRLKFVRNVPMMELRQRRTDLVRSILGAKKTERLQKRLETSASENRTQEEVEILQDLLAGLKGERYS